jgi:hypothetical protein
MAAVNVRVNPQQENDDVSGDVSLSEVETLSVSEFVIKANGNVGIFNLNPSVALEIGDAGTNCQVKVNGNVVVASNSNTWENIRPLSGSLELVKQFQGVSYTFKGRVIDETDETSRIKASSEDYIVSKELKDKTIYGFMAEDVEEVAPELVYRDDSTASLAIDYIGLIPLLTKAIQEQQAQIEAQQAQIDALLKIVSTTAPRSLAFPPETGSAVDLQLPQLQQNAPNPFNQSTQVSFYVPTTAQSAFLQVYDVNGVQKKSLPVSERGSCTVTIQASSLPAGIYFYTLLCDGKPVDTKQMVRAK